MEGKFGLGFCNLDDLPLHSLAEARGPLGPF